MKFPFLKINQKDLIFYITKINASFLKDHVNFHFRDPYTGDFTKRTGIDDYLEELEKMGFKVLPQEDGIQRRLQIIKVKKITEYLENSGDTFFPNSVILSANLLNPNMDEDSYMQETGDGIGFFDFPQNVEFQIVDGQHRLAGLFRSTKINQEDFILPVVLLINASKYTCAEIFADVNGYQSPVNRSQIYDLYGMRNTNNVADVDTIQKLHFLCKSFNEQKVSPIYKHVKMLGYGTGAISQSFFVNSMRRAFKEIGFDYKNMQYIYNCVFFYLKSFQRIFQNQWPVLENAENEGEFDQHSNTVLKIDKSQALKTNGLGAIMRAFPSVYKSVKVHDYQSYYDIVCRLDGKIDWCSEDLRKGTGDKTQKAICSILLNGMELLQKNKKTKKIIAIRTQAALIEIEYDSTKRIFFSKIVACTDGLVTVPPQFEKNEKDVITLMQNTLMKANNAENSFVLDVLQQNYNDDMELLQSCIDSCNLLVSIKENSLYPQNAFKAIENYGVEDDGVAVDKYKRIYSAEYLQPIRKALIEDCALNENTDFWITLQKPQT